MKNRIYCFTGTGNSLKVAKDIAEKLDECEVIPVNAALLDTIEKETHSKMERIGICFPVYAWGPPRIIRKFISKLQLPEECYCFAVTTCASSPGNTLPYLNRKLQKRSMQLSSGFVIHMPTNYLKMSGAVSEARQQEYFSNELKGIDRIVPILQQRKEHRLERSRWFVQPLAILLYRISYPFFKRMDKAFFTDEKCNGCGICEKICPVNNITMENATPSWHRDCEQCYACIQWCPQKAIQINKKTAGRERYHQPEISLNEMLR